MMFHSILFQRAEDRVTPEPSEAPAFFTDVNLDQVVDAITTGRQEYRLQPLFYTPLHDLDAIAYRHEIMRDLEDPTLLAHLQSFARKMRTMREYLAQAEKLHYLLQKQRWFVDAVATYCDAVRTLARDLSLVELHARGLLAFRDFVTDYAHSSRFASLLAETKQLLADLSDVRYSLRIRGNRVQVRTYAEEHDYSVEVTHTFEKFQQGAVKDYRVALPDWQEMNHVEAQVLELVAKLYPRLFAHLDTYCEARSGTYLDETIATFDQEVQFYLAYLEYIARLKRAGLPFRYPHLSHTSKEESAHEGFDLALAAKLLTEHLPVVCNDFALRGEERIIVVTGPNQGGKTTFARMVGQMHYLASLGCPVPGTDAHLFLCDQLFTHFEQEEAIANLRGKLQDDLVRIHEILRQATANSLIILNEIFTSTTVKDALFLSTGIMEQLLELDVLGVCVTFIDELSSLSSKTVSMVSTVVPDNPAERTYKIVRKPADGRAYAIAIAEKYRLTYGSIKERIPS